MRKLLIALMTLGLLVGLHGVSYSDHSTKTTSTSLTVSPSPAVYGQAVSFSGTITNEHDESAVSGGTVDVTRYTDSDCTAGASSAASDLPVTGVTGTDTGMYSGGSHVSGVPGTYYFKAVYSGTTTGHAGWKTSSSGCAALTVNKADTSFPAAAVTSPVVIGNSATVSFTVASGRGISGAVTGDITVTNVTPPSGASINCTPSSVAVSSTSETASGWSYTNSSAFSCTPDQTGDYTFDLTFTPTGDTAARYNGVVSSQLTLQVNPISEGRDGPAWANWHIRTSGIDGSSCRPLGANSKNSNWRGVVISQIAAVHGGVSYLDAAAAAVVIADVNILCTGGTLSP